MAELFRANRDYASELLVEFRRGGAPAQSSVLLLMVEAVGENFSTPTFATRQS
tara:strand:+ start:5335 stop:5493 length:159 start_codon:yes stop_codon:yes gene_type:complete